MSDIDPESATGFNRQKFLVLRSDGSTEAEQKHEKRPFFVLDLEHDKFAKPALKTYAAACIDEYPLLARDILKMIGATSLGRPRKDWDTVREKNRVSPKAWKIVAGGARKSRLREAVAEDGEHGYIDPANGVLFPERSGGPTNANATYRHVMDVAQDARVNAILYGDGSFGFELSSGYTIQLVPRDGKVCVVIEGPIIDHVDLTKLTQEPE